MSWEGCWTALSAARHRTLDSQGPTAKKKEGGEVVNSIMEQYREEDFRHSWIQVPKCLQEQVSPPRLSALLSSLRFPPKASLLVTKIPRSSSPQPFTSRRNEAILHWP